MSIILSIFLERVFYKFSIYAFWLNIVFFFKSTFFPVNNIFSGIFMLDLGSELVFPARARVRFSQRGPFQIPTKHGCSGQPDQTSKSTIKTTRFPPMRARWRWKQCVEQYIFNGVLIWVFFANRVSSKCVNLIVFVFLSSVSARVYKYRAPVVGLVARLSLLYSPSFSISLSLSLTLLVPP